MTAIRRSGCEGWPSVRSPAIAAIATAQTRHEQIQIFIRQSSHVLPNGTAAGIVPPMRSFLHTIFAVLLLAAASPRAAGPTRRTTTTTAEPGGPAHHARILVDRGRRTGRHAAARSQQTSGRGRGVLEEPKGPNRHFPDRESPVARRRVDPAGPDPDRGFHGADARADDRVRGRGDRLDQSGDPVAVHCAAGLGRSGTMAAVYLVADGASADEAITRVRDLRPGSIETEEQENAVRQAELHFSPVP